MSFFEELKRRNVIRVGIAYVVIAWLIARGCPSSVWTELITVLAFGEALVPIWERSMRCEPFSCIGWGNRASADILTGTREHSWAWALR